MEHLTLGDEVGCIQPGSYAALRVAPAWRVVWLPPDMSTDLAARPGCCAA